MEQYDRILWIWLSLTCGYANENATRLLKHFKTPGEIYAAGINDIAEQLFRSATAGRFADKSLDRAEEIFRYCEENDIAVVTAKDGLYPARLRHLPNRPTVLYLYGARKMFSEDLTVGFVGSRRPSQYAAQAGKRLAYDIARAGTTLISGLAEGIDTVAHQSALYAGMPTIAVLGNGIDSVYPRENEKLAAEIAENGLVLSEIAPKEAILREFFPQRNRIIAALSDAVVIVEASLNSGSLQTASFAKRYGKKVYALAGSVFDARCRGSNLLIREGAEPIFGALDILYPFLQEHGETLRIPEDFPPAEPGENGRADPKPAAKDNAADLKELGECELAILKALQKGDLTADELVGGRHDISQVLTALTLLELKELVFPVKGGTFSAVKVNF